MVVCGADQSHHQAHTTFHAAHPDEDRGLAGGWALISEWPYQPIVFSGVHYGAAFSPTFLAGISDVCDRHAGGRDAYVCWCPLPARCAGGRGFGQCLGVSGRPGLSASEN